MISTAGSHTFVTNYQYRLNAGIVEVHRPAFAAKRRVRTAERVKQYSLEQLGMLPSALQH